MGNDGGSIPTRRELVKEAARNPTSSQLKETQKEQQAHRWSTCSVSHKPLRRPVVSDSAGILYNKDAILHYLLPTEASSINKDEYDRSLEGRVKSLKDVVEVSFEVDPEDTGEDEKWICPVTSKALGPAVKAVYLVPCGHAFSHEAIMEMKVDQCLQCNTAYEARNVIPILPVAKDDCSFLENRIERLTEEGLTHSLKKVARSSKKRKANGTIECEVKIEAAVADKMFSPSDTRTAAPTTRSATPQSGMTTPKMPAGIKDAATASLTAKVLDEGTSSQKKAENDR